MEHMRDRQVDHREQQAKIRGDGSTEKKSRRKFYELQPRAWFFHIK